MSLILEALKKLERERTAPERGFLVVAQPGWHVTRPGGRVLAVAGASAAVAGALVAAILLWPARDRQDAAPTREAEGPRLQAPAVAEPLPSAAARVAVTPAPRTAGPARPPAEAAAFPVPPPVTTTSAPTAPPADAAGPDLKLQAVSEQDGQPVAVLNGRLVRAGDSFDGVTVIRIGAGEVEVEVGGRRRTLTF